jgi:hypothetical protein
LREHDLHRVSKQDLSISQTENFFSSSKTNFLVLWSYLRKTNLICKNILNFKFNKNTKKIYSNICVNLLFTQKLKKLSYASRFYHVLKNNRTNLTRYGAWWWISQEPKPYEESTINIPSITMNFNYKIMILLLTKKSNRLILKDKIVFSWG